MDWSEYDILHGSFEKCSLLTAVLTNLGLYILMFLGFVNQLLFKPNVATEKNREVSIFTEIFVHIYCRACGSFYGVQQPIAKPEVMVSIPTQDK